jgi:hypothetical protein
MSSRPTQHTRAVKMALNSKAQFIKPWVEHGSATRLETDIIDNTLKYSVGAGRVSGQQLQKIRHIWLHTGGCGSPKFHLFVIETD